MTAIDKTIWLENQDIVEFNLTPFPYLPEVSGGDVLRIWWIAPRTAWWKIMSLGMEGLLERAYCCILLHIPAWLETRLNLWKRRITVILCVRERTVLYMTACVSGARLRARMMWVKRLFMYMFPFFDSFRTGLTRSESPATVFFKFFAPHQASNVLSTWRLAWVANDLKAMSSSMMRWDLFVKPDPNLISRTFTRPIAETACISLIVSSTFSTTATFSYWRVALFLQSRPVSNALSIAESSCLPETGRGGWFGCEKILYGSSTLYYCRWQGQVRQFLLGWPDTYMYRTNFPCPSGRHQGTIGPRIASRFWLPRSSHRARFPKRYAWRGGGFQLVNILRHMCATNLWHCHGRLEPRQIPRPQKIVRPCICRDEGGTRASKLVRSQCARHDYYSMKTNIVSRFTLG